MAKNYNKHQTTGDENVQSSASYVEVNHSSQQTSSVGESNVTGQTSNVDLQTKVDELTADLQRIQADFVNFRRRSDDERGEFLTLAKQDVILQLLPVLDNIGRALSHLPDELSDNGWAKGVSQISKQAEETLKGLGVTRIDSIGRPFDPNLHEAIGYEEGEGDQEVVTEELQPGYKLGDKVIRHSMVKVGRKS